MTLPVPLTVRVGDNHITRQVQSLSFRREAIGGVRSISFTLARPLSDLDGLDALAKVYVYDARTAETVAQGRLADTGRTASADGQTWDCVAFGPAQAASDWSGPLVYVDRDTGAWYPAGASNAELSLGAGGIPDAATPSNGMIGVVREGLILDSTEVITARYGRLRIAGQKVGAFEFFGIVAGSTPGSGYTLEGSAVNIHPSGAVTGYETPIAAPFSTTPATYVASSGVHFTHGRDIVDANMVYAGVGGANGPDLWVYMEPPIVRTVFYSQDGVEETGRTFTTGDIEPLAHEVVADLLGRPGLMSAFDGASATIATTTTQLPQLAYPDGISPAQVLDDLMAACPEFRWTTSPGTDAGYGFSWETWPTTVRYEATLDDGGSFPLSTQQVYNRVIVNWTDPTRQQQSALVLGDCPLLDDEGLIRQAVISLGSEVGGTEAQAIAVGEAFLDEHRVPKNSGTLTVARPIRDVLTGALVQPWEVEPGELVRVRGVEAYPDAFNASTSDGRGVFRIHAVDYTTEGNVATLALDADPRTTADALVKLLNQRSRR